MNLFYFLIGLGVGYIIFKFVSWLFSSRIDTEAIKEEAKKEPLMEKQAREKVNNLRMVLEMFNSREKVVNDDVEKALSVSDATATNYLEELEREGKIKQVGTTGQNVYYELVS